MSYCEISSGHPFHGPYHDTEYGFPVDSDDVLFERLVLEINQAGLSWLTILKKRSGFRAAFDGFEIACVAAYGEVERTRLLSDAGIIRNRAEMVFKGGVRIDQGSKLSLDNQSQIQPGNIILNGGNLEVFGPPNTDTSALPTGVY